MRAAVVSVFCVVVGCGGGSTLPDGPEIDTPPGAHPVPRCQRIIDDLEAALTDRGSCTTPADCVVVGGDAPDAFPTCNCKPILLSCGGVVLAANAANLTQARALEADYWDTGCGDSLAGPNICDCAPYARLTCINGRCGGEADQCLVPPDAGVDAP